MNDTTPCRANRYCQAGKKDLPPYPVVTTLLSKE
jgi:hypothetical protein